MTYHLIVDLYDLRERLILDDKGSFPWLTELRQSIIHEPGVIRAGNMTTMYTTTVYFDSEESLVRFKLKYL